MMGAGRRVWLSAAIIGLLLAGGGIAAQTVGPGPAPTFKASVSALPFTIVVKDKSGKPRHGLTATDFTLKIDSKERSFADLTEMPEKPGTYIMTFEPAKADRDGKNHPLEISVRGGGTMKRTLNLPKQSSGDGQ
jgi:hypothetical protein